MTWKQIEGFPGYSVNIEGKIRNDNLDKIMALRVNQHGSVYVGLFKDGKQHARGVALLVCQAFLPPPTPPSFDTPIHLDGDLTNNHLENLMWRPRWFAVKYHNQFKHRRSMSLSGALQDKKTGEVYRNSMHVATTFGLLDREILFAVLNNSYVWPTYQEFREVG